MISMELTSICGQSLPFVKREMLFTMNRIFPSDNTMRDIYLAAIPLIACSLALAALLITMPGAAVWLPCLMPV